MVPRSKAKVRRGGEDAESRISRPSGADRRERSRQDEGGRRGRRVLAAQQFDGPFELRIARGGGGGRGGGGRGGGGFRAARRLGGRLGLGSAAGGAAVLRDGDLDGGLL